VWAALVFTFVFVALGLAVLFVAISGGPGGARKRMASQSRGTRRLALVNFLIALVVLGLGIPAAVIATVDNRDDIPEANVTNLTAGEKTGRQLFGERCANCHTLEAANAVAQVGPNLDDLLASQTDPAKRKAFVLDAIHNGRARGNGNMAADLVEGQDADDVAAFVAKATGVSSSN
jgi:mono/diheme cytochrome c family protein